MHDIFVRGHGVIRSLVVDFPRIGPRKSIIGNLG